MSLEEVQSRIDAALEAADYDGFAARAEASAARGRVRGRSAIYYMERTGGAPDENAEIEISADGDHAYRLVERRRLPLPGV